jgi:hypothetical protein
MCEPVDKKLTFQQSEVEYIPSWHTNLLYNWFSYWFVFPRTQLGNGDIICFQKASAMDNVKLFRYPNLPSYLNYVRSRYTNVATYVKYVNSRKVFLFLRFN